jgi:hypothetical protein
MDTEEVESYSKAYTLTEFIEIDPMKELMKLYYIWVKDGNTLNIRVRMGVEDAS